MGQRIVVVVVVDEPTGGIGGGAGGIVEVDHCFWVVVWLEPSGRTTFSDEVATEPFGPFS